MKLLFLLLLNYAFVVVAAASAPVPRRYIWNPYNPANPRVWVGGRAPNETQDAPRHNDTVAPARLVEYRELNRVTVDQSQDVGTSSFAMSRPRTIMHLFHSGSRFILRRVMIGQLSSILLRDGGIYNRIGQLLAWMLGDSIRVYGIPVDMTQTSRSGTRGFPNLWAVWLEAADIRRLLAARNQTLVLLDHTGFYIGNSAEIQGMSSSRCASERTQGVLVPFAPVTIEYARRGEVLNPNNMTVTTYSMPKPGAAASS